jgi:hypothetical protein
MAQIAELRFRPIALLEEKGLYQPLMTGETGLSKPFSAACIAMP